MSSDETLTPDQVTCRKTVEVRPLGFANSLLVKPDMHCLFDFAHDFLHGGLNFCFLAHET